MDGKKMEEGKETKFGWNDYAISDLPFRSYRNDLKGLSEFDKAMPKIEGLNTDPRIILRQLKSLDERIKLKSEQQLLQKWDMTESRDLIDNVPHDVSPDLLKQIRENGQLMREKYLKPSNLKTFIEKHLSEDGFLKEGETKYTFELTNKKLKINGKEQSNTMHEKYLKLYGEHTNTDSTDYDFTVKFNEK